MLKVKESKVFSGYKIAGACCIIMFLHQGIMASLDVFMPSIVEENNFSLGDVGVMYTYAGVTAALASMFLAPAVFKWLTPKGSLFLCSFLIAAQLYWYSLATHLWEYYAASVIGGVCISIGSVTAVSIIVGEWFIAKRSTILGIVCGASNFGTAVFQSSGGYLITNYGYRTAYRVCAIAIVILAVLTNLLVIRNKPADIYQEPLTDAEEGMSTNLNKSERNGLTFKESLKTPAFYLIFIACMFAIVGWMGYRTYFATLLRSNGYGMSIVSASNYSALLNIFAAAAIIIGGRIADMLGTRIYIICMSISLAIGILIMVLAGGSIVDMPVLLVVSMILAALSASNQSSTAPIICTEAFGSKGYATIIIYLIAAAQIGSAVMPLVVSAMLDNGISMTGCYWLFLVCNLTSLVFFLVGLAVSPLNRREK